MRQLLKKWQWYALFNLGLLVSFYLAGELHFSAESVVTVALVLGLFNVLTVVSGRKFKDWKK